MSPTRRVKIAVTILLAASLLVVFFSLLGNYLNQAHSTLPHEGRYGLYALDLATNKVTLIYSTDDEIQTSALRLNSIGDTLTFAQKIDGLNDEDMEIYTIGVEGKNLRRLTSNNHWDLYPVWSPDDAQIAFLSMRGKDLDIYVMNADGSDQRLFYDSGSHDADIDWAGDSIVYTSMFKIWRIRDNGTSAMQVTSPSDSGQWGTANLPIGDYDPRIRSDGAKIVFERLEDPYSLHGSYNIYVVNVDGSGETRLTNTGYAQGLADWSNRGDRIVYVVAAINNEGKYDMYIMNADGTDNHNVTPGYFSTSFLCYSPVFSEDDSLLFFIGQWS
jgi:Tol biopolymer transport system component